MRCSELRGLLWTHVDFEECVIRVRQRADYRNMMGPPKSAAGTRDIPMASLNTNTLREWKVACPTTSMNLVFPSLAGGVFANNRIHESYWGPLQRALGMVVPIVDDEGVQTMDDEGEPIMRPRYHFHSLRHAAASLFIEQGWSPKRVQAVMGHSSIQVTYDVYGHLWHDAEDDLKAMAQIEARLLRS
jgi:integrase